MKAMIVGLCLWGSVGLAAAAYVCPSPPSCEVVSDSSPPCFAVAWNDYSSGDSEAGHCVFKAPSLGTPFSYNAPSDSPDEGNLFTATVTHLSNGHWDLTLTNNRTATIRTVKFPWIVDHTDMGSGSCADTSPSSLGFKLGSTHLDDIFLEPYILGQATEHTVRNWWSWAPFSYGGRRAFEWNDGNPETEDNWVNAPMGFSPLLIRTDKTSAELLAATNWDTSLTPDLEPKNAWATWACNGWFIWYPMLEIADDETTHFRFMLTTSTGSLGLSPWMDVALDYQAWLRPLYDSWRGSLDYPGWIKNIHGFLNMGLMNFMDGMLQDQVETWRWEPFGEALPWAQFWGQMSDYAGVTGGCDDPEIPDDVGPQTACGCCGQCRRIHQRYQTDDEECPGWDLVEYVEDTITTGDGRAGFYIVPRCENILDPSSCPMLDQSTPTVSDATDCTNPSGACPTTTESGSLSALEWLQSWEALSRDEWGANAVYYDTLGGVHYGPPMFVANLFKGSPSELSMDSLSEWICDVYPPASLAGGDNVPGANRLENIWSGDANEVSFPELGNVILSDRVFFSGYSDNALLQYGICHDYYSERQSFLWGHKFDVGVPFEQVVDIWEECPADNDFASRAAAVSECLGGWAIGTDPNVPPIIWTDDEPPQPCWNIALKLAMQERDAHDWWDRPMRFQERKGLSAVPLGADIRRFSDEDSPSARIVAVDNWNLVSGRFCVDNIVFPLPNERLSILEGSDLADSDSDHIGDSLEGQIVATGDTDSDSLIASCDNCPNHANASQLDVDLDGYGDACDSCVGAGATDSDSDGLCSEEDNCPANSNPTQADGDADGVGDACDLCPSVPSSNNNDSDADGDGDVCDNCPYDSNSSQTNSDGDSLGDACDNCPSVTNADQADCDEDYEGDACETTQYVTLYSESSNDGYVVLPAAAFSNPLFVGDVPVFGGSSKTHRGIASFDTSGLDTDQIRSASVSFKRYTLVGNPGGLGPLRVDVKDGTFGSASLETGDYTATASGTLAASLSIPGSVDTWSSVTFVGSTELGWVNNTGGRTQVRLRLTTETDNDGAIDRVGWYAGETSGSKPYLTVGFISCN